MFVIIIITSPRVRKHRRTMRKPTSRHTVSEGNSINPNATAIGASTHWISLLERAVSISLAPVATPKYSGTSGQTILSWPVSHCAPDIDHRIKTELFSVIEEVIVTDLIITGLLHCQRLQKSV